MEGIGATTAKRGCLPHAESRAHLHGKSLTDTARHLTAQRSELMLPVEFCKSDRSWLLHTSRNTLLLSEAFAGLADQHVADSQGACVDGAYLCADLHVHPALAFSPVQLPCLKVCILLLMVPLVTEGDVVSVQRNTKLQPQAPWRTTQARRVFARAYGLQVLTRYWPSCP